MGYRQVVIRHSERIHTEDNCFVLERLEKESVRIPLEDINFILIEDLTTVITCQLLSILGKNGISLIVCDEKHEPISIMYPYSYHYKQLEVLEKQLALMKEDKDGLWQIVVQGKIENEIRVLEKTTKDEPVIAKLYQYREEVAIGDTTNREGLAAKLYFRSLFGSEFIRFYDDAINAALNYAYTIVKSSILRTLVVYGLLPYLGIHHCSKVNQFNLAYDLLEPYRALIDYYVYHHQEKLSIPLSYECRKSLVDVLNVSVLYDGKRCTIEYSIDLLVQNLVKSLTTGEMKLMLPQVDNG